MKKVLMVVDERGGAKSVLSVHRALVREPETVVVVHVQRPADRTALLRDMIDQRHHRRDQAHGEGSDRILGFCEKELEKAGTVKVKTVLREGDPSEEILNLAREERVDLIIIADDGFSLFRPFVRGSVFKAVERSTSVPVLVAKRSRGEKSYTVDWKENKTYAA
jgi:nucleotide-binding universal stress UspA family protein